MYDVGGRGSVVVAAHHLIWTVYGWWLPNDPRGSSSREVRVERIAELGELHHGRKANQPSTVELRAFYQRAAPLLAHATLAFDEQDVAILAESLAGTIQRRSYTCYACALMPDHVHLLIRRHRDRAEQMIAEIQADGRAALLAGRRRPPNHPVWGGPGWKVFLRTQEDIRRIVGYIEANPRERNLPPQHWSFVQPYDGWLPTREK